MIDAAKSSVPGRELGVLGRDGVPVAMLKASGPVRRRAADGRWRPALPDSAGRERPSASRSCIRAREGVASII
jgi:hypothetical protein